MKSLFAALTPCVLAFALAGPANAQNQSEIVGTWKFVSHSLTEVPTGKVSKYYGEKPKGYISYSKGGHIVFVLFDERRQKPATPFKDEDKVKLFDSLSAGSGTYKVEGNQLIITYDTSWLELWTDTTQSRTFEVKDKKLTITSAPSKNANGIDIVFTLVLEKVE